MLNPIQIEDVEQDDDPRQVVYVRPTHNWEDVQLRCAHAFERQMERLVRVDVRKIQRVD